MATLRETFKDIADAIREKGVVGTMTPSQMPSKIDSIEVASGVDAEIVMGTIGGDYVNDRITYLKPGAFSNCANMTSCSCSMVDRVGANAFLRCSSIKTITLPNCGVVGSSPFAYCSEVESILIPEATSIDTYAFQYCSKLKVVDFRGRQLTTIPTLSSSNAFYNVSSYYKIVVPDALYDRWISATNWATTSIKSHIVKQSEYVEG